MTGVERLRRAALDAVSDNRCQTTRLEVLEATREANGSYACVAWNEPETASASGLKRARYAIAIFSLLVLGTSVACILDCYVN